MTDVARPLSQAFSLSDKRLNLLVEAVTTGRVVFPTIGLKLPLGVRQSRINSFLRDLRGCSSKGIDTLQEELAATSDQAEINALRRKIDEAPDRYRKAVAGLPKALQLRGRRETALQEWLSCCGLRPAELAALVQSLRYNVTYLCYKNGPQKLYVELD